MRSASALCRLHRTGTIQDVYVEFEKTKLKEARCCKEQQSDSLLPASWRLRNQMTFFDFQRKSHVLLFWLALRTNSWLLMFQIYLQVINTLTLLGCACAFKLAQNKYFYYTLNNLFDFIVNEALNLFTAEIIV